MAESTILEINRENLQDIHQLAHRIWPHAFAEILSKAQIDYMLNMMYSMESLEQQFDEGVHFLLIEIAGRKVGFAGFQFYYKNEPINKIHKIYLLPETQGKGLGKLLIDEISSRSVSKGIFRLQLNVNRFNKATNFYKHLGFEVIAQEDIDIGSGFLMEDFIMEKPLYNVDRETEM